jgi:hypothetical protein
MLVPLVSRKGRRVHRRAGWMFVAGMAVVCVTAVTAFAIANAGRLGVPGDSLVVWLGPTVVGVPILLIWTAYYHWRFSRRHRAMPIPRIDSVID